MIYADLLVALKRPDEAIAEYRSVVETPGYRDPLGWIRLGSAYRKMERPRVDEAVAAYQKALELDAKNSTAALGIGIAYYAGKRYDEATDAFQAAKRMAPEVTSIADEYLALIEKTKKSGAGPTPPPRPKEEEPDLAELARWIQSSDPRTRLQGVRGLCRLGREAVDPLVWVVPNESNWEIRMLAVTCLGDVGPGARAAIPYLRQILRSEAQVPPVGATRQQLEDEVRLSDLKRKAREALARIER